MRRAGVWAFWASQVQSAKSDDYRPSKPQRRDLCALTIHAAPDCADVLIDVIALLQLWGGTAIDISFDRFEGAVQFELVFSAVELVPSAALLDRVRLHAGIASASFAHASGCGFAVVH